VDWLEVQQRIQMMWIGRLEGPLARHWPEATRVVELASMKLLNALAYCGGSAPLAADPEAVQGLKVWAQGRTAGERAEPVLAAAVGTAGTRQGTRDVLRVRQYATLALAARRETQQARRRLKELAGSLENVQRLSGAVGLGTACVLWVLLGDPRNYPCGAAYREALGLNLNERSSGKHKGWIKISKRGPGIARRWLLNCGAATGAATGRAALVRSILAPGCAEPTAAGRSTGGAVSSAMPGQERRPPVAGMRERRSRCRQAAPIKVWRANRGFAPAPNRHGATGRLGSDPPAPQVINSSLVGGVCEIPAEASQAAARRKGTASQPV
jgi:hypothetical protein